MTGGVGETKAVLLEPMAISQPFRLQASRAVPYPQRFDIKARNAGNTRVDITLQYDCHIK